ncbi:MAG TPA: PQQ-binding-like beta-propeller repeat protein, partial [Pirellulales bacterium]
MPLPTRRRVFGPSLAATLAAFWLASPTAFAADIDAAQATDPVPGPAPALKVDPLDWPYWRGPEYNGISRETDLPEKFDESGEGVLWSNPELGTRSSPILMHGKLYTTCNYKPRTDREGEMVVCADANTGKILWRTHFNVFLSDVPDTRVGWPPLTGDPTTGRIYCQGVGGLFLCLEGDTGKVVWDHSMSEEYGLLTTYGGRTNSPVVFEDLVIISGVMTGWGELSRPVHRFMAFDKATGETRWQTDTKPLPDDTTYSVPIIAVLGGQSALVAGASDGALYAIQPRTGNVIWKYQISPRGLNLTPLAVGDTVYMGNSEENIDDNTMG